MDFSNISIRNILEEAMKKQAVIIDVRETEDFIKGHIPMAFNLPLKEIKVGNIKLPRGRTYILYCEMGGASALAAKILSEKGHNVINCVGGIKDYKGNITKKYR